MTLSIRTGAGPLILGIVLVLATSGCEHAGPVGANNGGVQPTLRSIQENVFTTSCALSQCHAPPNPQQGMDLSAGQARESIVNVRSNERPELFRVEPGRPDSSYLVHKIEGGPNIVGERMPRGREPLSRDQIDAIRQWIANGAPDD